MILVPADNMAEDTRVNADGTAMTAIAKPESTKASALNGTDNHTAAFLQAAPAGAVAAGAVAAEHLSDNKEPPAKDSWR